MTPAVESHRLIVRATNINRSNEKSFVLFAFRWRIDSTDDNNEGENDETPMCRTYQTSSRAPVQSLLRYLSMDWVSNNKLHNWWRCCWQFPDLCQSSTDLRRLTMVNRQILIFEVAIGRKSMIRSTAKIPPILVCERSFLRVVSAIDVMIEEKRSLRGQPRQPRQDLN